MKQKGFTLIELLVVIAIIGILAGILFVAINPSEQTDKALAVKIANDFKSIKEAFQMTALDLNSDLLYPIETCAGVGQNPSIKTMVNKGCLKYIDADIDTNLNSSAWYGYDNDGDIYNGSGSWHGPNILIWNSGISSDSFLISELDRILDNSDGLGVGKFRYYSPLFGFSLSWE